MQRALGEKAKVYFFLTKVLRARKNFFSKNKKNKK